MDYLLEQFCCWSGEEFADFAIYQTDWKVGRISDFFSSLVALM